MTAATWVAPTVATADLSSTAVAVCRHQHPAEWDAPHPRTHACATCWDLAVVAIGSYTGGVE